MSPEAADPISAHYLQSLQRRADAHGDDAALQAVLNQRIQNATAVLKGRSDAPQPKPNGNTSLPEPRPHNSAPKAAALLQDLVRHIDSQSRHAQPRPSGVPQTAATVGPDVWMKDDSPVAYFRNTWSRLRVDKKVALALELAPKNAGPINSHHLVLRSLAQMQDISPGYLNRFVTYVDALQSLDATGWGLPKAPKPALAKAAEKKPAPKRGKKN